MSCRGFGWRGERGADTAPPFLSEAEAPRVREARERRDAAVMRLAELQEELPAVRRRAARRELLEALALTGTALWHLLMAGLKLAALLYLLRACGQF